MKMIIALAALVAVALAAPQGYTDSQGYTDPVILVKETPSDNIGTGPYNFGYELSNGESRQESAELKDTGYGGEEALTVSGKFSWVDPTTNQRYTVTYTADENGFHPVGDHIPA